MGHTSRKTGIALAIAIVGTAIVLPGSAEARWRHGGWHGHHGHWHGGGWGWGGFGLGLGTGLLLAGAPYYGGYYGYGPYAYQPYGYGHGGGCYVRRRAVYDGYGHRHWRRVRVCY
jgi:hypothetical protein